MTDDRQPTARPRDGQSPANHSLADDGLANDSVGAARRPAGQGPGTEGRPAAGIPQGKPLADEQVPRT